MCVFLTFAYPTFSLFQCAAQGFTATLGTHSAILHNSFITLIYVFLVKFNWSDDRIWKFIPWLCAFSWIVGLVMSAVVIPKDFFNFNEFSCLIGTFPKECGFQDDGSLVMCKRGTDFDFAQRWIYAQSGIAVVWIGSLIVNFCILFSVVRKLERRVSRYSGARSSSTGSVRIPKRVSGFFGASTGSTPSSDPEAGGSSSSLVLPPQPRMNRAKSNAVAFQGILYCVMFSLAGWWWVGIQIMTKNGIDVPFWYTTLGRIHAGLQGVYATIIFLRTRKNTMKTRAGERLRNFLFCISCRSCFCQKEEEKNDTEMSSPEQKAEPSPGVMVSSFNLSDSSGKKGELQLGQQVSRQLSVVDETSNGVDLEAQLGVCEGNEEIVGDPALIVDQVVDEGVPAPDIPPQKDDAASLLEEHKESR